MIIKLEIVSKCCLTTRCASEQDETSKIIHAKGKTSLASTALKMREFQIPNS